MQTIYFDADYAIRVHDWIIEHSGGVVGVLNRGNLESPLGHIQNDSYYPKFVDKLTHLVYSVNKNHAFNDGNKRSSIALGAHFLELNGYGYVADYFPRKMENIAVWVAGNIIDKELLKELINSLIFDDDYTDELKLELIHVAQQAGDHCT